MMVGPETTSIYFLKRILRWELLEKRRNNITSVSQRIGGVLPPSLLIVLNIFLFGPVIIYKGNMDEFAVSLASILSLYLLPALVLFTILTGIGLLLPSKLHRRYIATIFVIGVLIWLQGNILVWQYGLLDGRSINWSANTWRGWIDGTVWVLLLTIVCFFYKNIYKIAVRGSVVVICLQCFYLGYMIIQDSRVLKEKDKISLPAPPPKEIFQFSSGKNVIHVILDQFQSDIFKEIIDREPGYFEALKGFTFFKETTGSFPTTYMSIPAIFSGQNYKNDIPMSIFLQSILGGKTLPNSLHDAGYEVQLAHSLANYRGGSYSSYYHIPVPYGLTELEHEKATSALVLDLAFFRSAPHFLKRFIYNDQQWLIQRLLFGQLRGLQDRGSNLGMLRYFAHTSFLKDLVDNMSIGISRPVYKFVHLINSHGAFVVNEDCQYAGKALPTTRENVKNQQRCALDQVLGFLNKLKSIGIYDSSLIVIHADHGAGIKVKFSEARMKSKGLHIGQLESIVGSALPLMLIKPPFVEGQLKISNAQAMLTDIPATISSILDLNEDFPGQSIYNIDENMERERKFYHYSWRNENWKEDFVSRLNEFTIKGSVFNRTSWHHGLVYHQPNTFHPTEKIDFGSIDSSRFKHVGWGGNERSAAGNYKFNWALGSQAAIFLSLSKNRPTVLTANIRSYPVKKYQYITITVDGNAVGNWKLFTPWSLGKHSIIIPPDAIKGEVSTVDFTFSQHRIPKKDGDPRPLAVLFESITLNETKNTNQ